MFLSDFHSVFNHFTIAFIFAGAAREYYAFVTRQQATDYTGARLLALAAALVLLSIVTGFIAQSRSYIDPSVLPILSSHKTIYWISGGTLGLSLALRFRFRPMFQEGQKHWQVRSLYMGLVTVTLLLSTISGYLGMQLVYGHGVSVRPYEQLIETLPALNQSNPLPILADTATPKALSPKAAALKSAGPKGRNK